MQTTGDLYAAGLYAAQIRTEIDRVYVGLRRAAGPSTRAIVERHHVAGGAVGILADVYFAILDHPIPAVGIAAVTRYDDPADVAASIDVTARAGLVTADRTGGIALTGTGRVLMCEIETAIGDVSWGSTKGALPRLNDLLARLLDAGRATGGDAFAAMTPPHEPPGAPPALLFGNRLGALRHHRADAHAAAWTDHGFTAAEVVALTDDALRRSVDVDTNRRDAPIYAVLTDGERHEFRVGLAALAP